MKERLLCEGRNNDAASSWGSRIENPRAAAQRCVVDGIPIGELLQERRLWLARCECCASSSTPSHAQCPSNSLDRESFVPVPDLSFVDHASVIEQILGTPCSKCSAFAKLSAGELKRLFLDRDTEQFLGKFVDRGPDSVTRTKGKE